MTSPTKGMVLGCGLLALAPAMESPAAANDFYRGKTVNYIVATAAGGAYDGYGRLSARYMEKHLPGSTFVVLNRPGAGHVIGANLIYASKPDGLTVGSFNMGIIYSQLVGSKAAQYDLGKMSWIGKAATDKRVIMVGMHTSYKTWQDFQQAKKPITLAISGVGGASHSELQMLGSVFDINFRLLPGYSGNDDDMAIMRGDVDGKMGGMVGQGHMVRSGRGRFVIQIGGSRETGFGEMSYYEDVIKTPDQKAVMYLISSQNELMRITVGPPAIPADRLEALRDAYRKSYTDPELLAAAEKMQYSVDPAIGADMEPIIQAALNQPPRIMEMLKKAHDPAQQ